MTFIVLLILTMLALFGLYVLYHYLYVQIKFKDSGNIPKIFLATISKHSSYEKDREVAEEILESYKKVEDFKTLLLSESNVNKRDYNLEVKQLKGIMGRHKHIAQRYAATNAYEKDRKRVKDSLREIKVEFQKLEESAGVRLIDLYKVRNKVVEQSQTYLDGLTIHKDNINKCNTVRLYNHKAKPLKDLSSSLVEMLENLKALPDREDQRIEIVKQLTELSKVIDITVEALPTYDSKSFVDNKLKVNKRLLEELKNADYVDVLRIEKPIK